RSDRQTARERVGAERFFEIFVDTPLEICEQRDPKQLYRRARAGEISEFTGVSAPYERPDDPALVLDTTVLSPEASLERLFALLRDNGMLPAVENSNDSPGTTRT